MEKIKVGDIVRLVSGGPRMTVSKVIEGTPEPKETKGMPAWGEGGRESSIQCKWFVREKLDMNVFPPEALEKVSTDKE